MANVKVELTDDQFLWVRSSLARLESQQRDFDRSEARIYHGLLEDFFQNEYPPVITTGELEWLKKMVNGYCQGADEFPESNSNDAAVVGN